MQKFARRRRSCLNSFQRLTHQLSTSLITSSSALPQKESTTACVAGDYVFPICDAVDSSAKVKWIGCANELNASYAADGYARIRGAAMLATTYGVGELSAINGVMGANAERSLVFHVVGMPSYQHQRLHKIAHHTLGDGVFACLRRRLHQNPIGFRRLNPFMFLLLMKHRAA